jgi:hypothetical protein
MPNELISQKSGDLSAPDNTGVNRKPATRRGFFADALSGADRATYERSLEAGQALDLTDDIALTDTKQMAILLRVKDNDTIDFRLRLLKWKKDYAKHVESMNIAKDKGDKDSFDLFKGEASACIDSILKLIELGGTEAQGLRDGDMVVREKAMLHDQQLKFERAVYETKAEMLKDGNLVSAFNFFVSLIEAIHLGKMTPVEAMSEAGKWKSSLG